MDARFCGKAASRWPPAPYRPNAASGPTSCSRFPTTSPTRTPRSTARSGSTRGIRPRGAARAHCSKTASSTPSCGPSRGSVLSGQDFYRLREASMNHTVWPPENDIALYTDLLGEAGYRVGYTGKPWGPGNWKGSGRQDNPAGPVFNQIKLTPPGEGISNVDYAANFEAFLDGRSGDQPFCFWAGFMEPHRIFEDGIGVRHGKTLDDITTPGFFPDVNEVRSDLADYAFEIEHYDKHLGRMLDLLEQRGELDNTIVVCTADNGMAFPRAKATIYDYGAHVPLAIRWGDRVEAGRKIDDFVSFPDFAPTFLEAAGTPVPRQMTGRSLLPYSSGAVRTNRPGPQCGGLRHRTPLPRQPPKWGRLSNARHPHGGLPLHSQSGAAEHPRWRPPRLGLALGRSHRRLRRHRRRPDQDLPLGASRRIFDTRQGRLRQTP
ncbi:MAG: sulfatase-like hydrolase/transferase [Bryobacterales bacterium]